MSRKPVSYRTSIAVGSAAIEAAIAAKVYDTFLTQGQAWQIAMSVAVVAAVIAHFILTILLISVPLRIAGLRKLILPEAGYEGTWIQTVQSRGRRLYSHLTISYVSAEDSLLIEGEAFTEDGVVDSRWRTKHATPRPGEQLLRFEYIANLTADPTAGGGLAVVEGFGETQFRLRVKGYFQQGAGSYIDTVNKNSQARYEMDRLTENLVHALIGKRHVETRQDIRELVRKYASDHGRRILFPMPDPGNAAAR